MERYTHVCAHYGENDTCPKKVDLVLTETDIILFHLDSREVSEAIFKMEISSIEHLYVGPQECPQICHHSFPGCGLTLVDGKKNTLHVLFPSSAAAERFEKNLKINLMTSGKELQIVDEDAVPDFLTGDEL